MWAKEVVNTLKKHYCDDVDDATREFCRCYADGDSLQAWECYSGAAEEQIDLGPNGNNTLLIFPDGSCYADWQQDIWRFGQTVQDFADDIISEAYAHWTSEEKKRQLRGLMGLKEA